MNKDLSYAKIKKSLKSYFLNLKSSFGFTLIEILIVIAIISILSIIMFVNFSVIPKARDSKRKADLRQIEKALEQYRSDNGNYPNSGGITDLINCPTDPPLTFFGNAVATPPPPVCTTVYLNKVPTDPSGSTYWYSGNYFYYSLDGKKYYLVACLENASDPQGLSHDPLLEKVSDEFGASGVSALGVGNGDFGNDCPSQYGYLIIGQ